MCARVCVHVCMCVYRRYLVCVGHILWYAGAIPGAVSGIIPCIAKELHIKLRIQTRVSFI